MASALGTIALTLAGGIVGAAATYALADSQEVRAQGGVAISEIAEDARTPPVRAENIEQGSNAEAIAFSDRLDPADVDQAVVDGGGSETVRTVKRTETYVPGSPPATSIRIGFTLVGQHNVPVQIKKITARITGSEPSPSGTIVILPPEEGQGGATETLGLVFPIEGSATSFEAMVPAANDYLAASDRPFFEQNQITLEKDERVTFDAIITARDCTCDFVLDVAFDNNQTMTLDSFRIESELRAEAPFRIASFAKQYTLALQTVQETVDASGNRRRITQPCMLGSTCRFL